MIPPTTNELKQHSNDIINFGKNHRKMNGSSKVLVNVAAVVVAMISVAIFLAQIATEIV